MSENAKKMEAVLFAVGRTISEQEIQALTGLAAADVHAALVELKKEYEDRHSPLFVMQSGDGWKLTVHESYLPIVQQINPHTELSKAVLETLAVIAWKQPATQSEIIKVRTNKAYEHIDELERLGFVSKEKHGRSYVVRVTNKFLEYFDLKGKESIRDLFKDIKDSGEAQAKLVEKGENLHLETYGIKEDVQLEKEGKEHVGSLEVFEDIEPEKKEEETESVQEEEENPVKDFIKENKTLAPQEEELLSEKKEIKEENKKDVEQIKREASKEEAEEEQKEEIQEAKVESEERELDPELEEMAKNKKK